jgi:hypothetical protein
VRTASSGGNDCGGFCGSIQWGANHSSRSALLSRLLGCRNALAACQALAESATSKQLGLCGNGSTSVAVLLSCWHTIRYAVMSHLGGGAMGYNGELSLLGHPGTCLVSLPCKVIRRVLHMKMSHIVHSVRMHPH